MTSFSPGLCSVTFRHLKAASIIGAARKAHLTAIEWGGDIHVPPRQVETARSVGAWTRAAGLLPASYGSYVDPPSSDMANFESALGTATALGAINIRIWPGTRGRPSSEYSVQERSRTAASINAMAQEAARHGVSISLEHHPNSLTDDTDSAARLMDEIAHRNVYLCWQPRPGLPLRDALVEIGRLGTSISHIHVFAWDESRVRFPLADQEDYWCELLQAMPPSCFPGPRYAFLEFVAHDDLSRFEEDAATLSRLLAEQTMTTRKTRDGNVR
ncbi:sugar phosphate isomerase/epimerase family protein [Microvirga alba]|uniref:TIM barrel protein n=1 Tax=Microvirga alba TaxID=2791025 RepID=A0A931FNL5_9HYPH|nr:TIM barrel protein [Microvirga alba]MBF9232447.1 TIM barrel protein [Microvirga alba]